MLVRQRGQTAFHEMLSFWQTFRHVFGEEGEVMLMPYPTDFRSCPSFRFLISKYLHLLSLSEKNFMAVASADSRNDHRF